MSSEVHAYSKTQQLGAATPEMVQEQYIDTERERFNRPPSAWGTTDPVFCAECDSRPCMDSCTTQQMPDTLERKAARAGLTPLAWLQRDQERHGAPVHERYPDHPAAAEVRAVLADVAGLSATQITIEE